VLTTDQHAALAQHVAACPSCAQLRARLAEATDAFRADVANVAVPAADAEWRTLRARLHGDSAKSAKRRSFAPVIWFGSSLAAAAALAFVFVGSPPKPVEPAGAAPEIAQAEFVEAGNANASTMVYVDKESGWLVVWAAEGAPKTSG
jgi:hypothetical protein